MLTRLFKSGNSLAVRIPKELALFESDIQEVEIEWRGDGLWIRPIKRKTLAGIGDIFAMFSEDFMTEPREFHDQKERNWKPSDEDLT